MRTDNPENKTKIEVSIVPRSRDKMAGRTSPLESTKQKNEALIEKVTLATEVTDQFNLPSGDPVLVAHRAAIQRTRAQQFLLLPHHLLLVLLLGRVAV